MIHSEKLRKVHKELFSTFLFDLRDPRRTIIIDKRKPYQVEYSNFLRVAGQLMIEVEAMVTSMCYLDEDIDNFGSDEYPDYIYHNYEQDRNTFFRRIERSYGSLNKMKRPFVVCSTT